MPTPVFLPKAVATIVGFGVSAVNEATKQGLHATLSICSVRYMADKEGAAWLGKSGVRAAMQPRCSNEASFKKYVARAQKVDEVSRNTMVAAHATAIAVAGHTPRVVFDAIVKALLALYPTEKALLEVIEPKDTTDKVALSPEDKMSEAFASLVDTLGTITMSTERMGKLARICTLRAAASSAAFKRDEHGQVVNNGATVAAMRADTLAFIASVLNDETLLAEARLAAAESVRAAERERIAALAAAESALAAERERIAALGATPASIAPVRKAA